MISKINSYNTSFNSKKLKSRNISDNMRASIESLLLRMNKETSVQKSGDSFLATTTKKLVHENGAEFIDNRNLKHIVTFPEQMQGSSTIKTGRVMMEINNETGEIIQLQKPFFKTWSSIQKKIELLLNDFRANFYNTKTVKKETVEFIV